MFERAKTLSHIGGRPAASLSSGLLARKGHAAPAMRPQLGGGFVSSFGADLGWNDMGHEPSQAAVPEPLPPVLALREELAERIVEPIAPAAEAPIVEPGTIVDAAVAEQPDVAEPIAEPAAVRGRAPRILRPDPAPSISSKVGQVRRAAFTLRLDAERHRKLRVAALLDHRSCQQLVTRALDQFLATMPEVAEWADRLPRDEAPKS